MKRGPGSPDYIQGKKKEDAGPNGTLFHSPINTDRLEEVLYQLFSDR